MQAAIGPNHHANRPIVYRQMLEEIKKWI